MGSVTPMAGVCHYKRDLVALAGWKVLMWEMVLILSAGACSFRIPQQEVLKGGKLVLEMVNKGND